MPDYTELVIYLTFFDSPRELRGVDPQDRKERFGLWTC
jgi:hypothetical protein